MADAVTPGPKPKPTKDRSPNYPSVGLGEALPLVKKLWDHAKRTSVAPETAASVMGFQKLTGPVASMLAALKKYGLVESGKDGLSITNLALQLIQYPPDSVEYETALLRAALSPEIFKELYRTHRDASDAVLRPYLVTAKGFSETGADQFIKAFRDTIQVAGLVGSDYTPPDDDDEEEHSVSETPMITGVRGTERHTPPKGLGGGGGGYYTPPQHSYCWPLPGGVTVEVRFTGPAGPEHFDFLRQYLELAKKASALNETNAPDAGHEGK